MIRQRKNKLTLKKNSFRLQDFQQAQINDQNVSQRVIEKQNVFEESILNKFFNISINAERTINYTKKGRKRQLIKSQRPFLLFKQEKSRKKFEPKFCKENKENQQTSERQENLTQQEKQKLTLLQTTGNMMLSFKSFKRKQYTSRLQRPFSSASNSVRSSSIQLQQVDNSISQILAEIRNSQSNFPHNKDKISTSKALQMFSKVVRNQNQNSSRDLIRKKINNNSQDRYRSVSVLANKVKIEPKQVKINSKIDFKTYIKKFKMNKKQSNIGNPKSKQQVIKQQDFNLKGWDTSQFQMF